MATPEGSSGKKKMKTPHFDGPLTKIKSYFALGYQGGAGICPGGVKQHQEGQIYAAG